MNKKGQNIVITLSVTISIVFYQIFTKYVTDVLASNDQLGIVLIGVVTSTGIFFACFNLLLFIYYSYFEDIFFPKEAISGKWFYKLEVFGSESSTKFGICSIEKEGRKLSATGIHFDPEKGVFSSMFSTDHLLVENDSDLKVNFWHS